METGCKKSKLFYAIQAFLISFACTVQFHKPLLLGAYEEKRDYLLAQAAELLGEYRFTAVLIFSLAYGFLLYIDRAVDCRERKKWTDWLLPLFFSFCLFMGQSFQETNSWNYCFGSLVNFVKFVLALCGMTILLQKCRMMLEKAYEYLSESCWQNRVSRWLFGKHCFLKIFFLLLLLWLPVILLSFPGNLCYDVIGQIEQVVGRTAYSAHHPLLHTLLVGGLVQLGKTLMGSYDAGLFLYILVQALLLASALAGTIWWLNRQEFERGRVSHLILLVILGVYVFSPMYSNMASTAIKDIPFVAAVIWYVILLAELCFHRQRLKDWRFAAIFLAVQVLMSLLRNNGFYVMVLTGAVFCVLWWKQSERAMRVRMMFCLLLLPVLLSRLFSGILLTGLSAEKGKAAEMFSLPFQQTARYLQLYREELTMEEKTAIEAVLGDTAEIAKNYNPDLADPVKRLYYEQDEVTGKELAGYFAVWGKDFFKHPCVYLEAFFAHVYGWFDPAVSNAPRYEAECDLFLRKGLFKDADKVLLFVYRLADRVTPLGLLQNVGAYTWGLFLLWGYLWKKNKKSLVLLTPLLVSLLICMVSPCFYLHPRYAYPYMFTLPFLYGLAERSRE